VDVVAAMSPEVIVAAISAVIAVLALAISAEVHLRQTAIQERVAAIEEARRAEEIEARGRARVTASMQREQRDTRGRDLRLVLHNDGPALARSVQAAVEEEPQTPGVLGLEALPVDLQPGQFMRFVVTVGLRDTTTMRVTVRWTDEAGDHEEPFTLQVL
jgi:hypothetical protein